MCQIISMLFEAGSKESPLCKIAPLSPFHFKYTRRSLNHVYRRDQKPQDIELISAARLVKKKEIHDVK